MRARVLIIGVAIVALIGGFMTIRANSRAAESKRQAAPAPQAAAPVVAVAAKRADLVSTVAATGTISSLRESKIASKLQGRVAKVFVREGQRVAAGAALMRLESGDLEAQEAQARASVDMAKARLAQMTAGARPEERRQAAEAAAQAEAGVQAARARLQALERGARPQEREQVANAVAQAKAALDLAQADVARIRSLYQMGAVSKQQLDAAETQLRVAQAAYDTARQQQALVSEGPRVEEIQAARAQLAQAQAAADIARQTQRLVEIGPRAEEMAAARAQVDQAQAVLAAARLRVQDATVTAPFAGTILRRMVEPGESVSPLAPSFVLGEVQDVFVELIVPERQRTDLRVGQSAVVAVDAFPKSRLTGKVEEIQPAASTASRTFTVKVRVANPERLLRPGMFARGVITTAVRSNVLQVPDRAVLLASGKKIVFVVKDGQAVRREVTVGEQQGGLAEVVEGLEAGDQVIVEGHEGLTDNQAVAPRATP
jgi:RND family efflux transporter MFP subunit